MTELGPTRNTDGNGVTKKGILTALVNYVVSQDFHNFFRGGTVPIRGYGW